MKTKNIFYITGILAFINGLLVLNGINLPRRDGTMIENPIQYGKETMLFGIAMIIITAIVSFILERKSKE